MNFNLSVIAGVFALSIASVSSANANIVTFEALAKSNAKYPAVQLYLAEASALSGNYDQSVNHYITSIELGMESAVWPLMGFIDKGILAGDSLNNAIKKVKLMARDNDTLSLFLANYYHQSQNRGADAFHWANNALRLGSKGIGEILAGYILNDIGGANLHYSAQEAASLLKNAVQNGSGSAAISLAVLFDEGTSIAGNLGQARHYYSIASEAGVLDANLRLAYFLEHGIGGDKDLKKAAELYNTLLNTDDAANAHYRLSVIYMYSDGLFENSKVDGVAHLIKAAKLNHPDALYKTGVATYYGTDGFKVNADSAIEKLTLAARAGSKLAAQRLIQLYSNGERSVPANKELVKEFQRILMEAPKI